jgi:hypothetical protein
MKTRSLVLVALAATLGACGGGNDNPTGPSSSNGNPTASMTASETAAIMGATAVTFTASGSDPNGDALSYSWNFGDGTTGSGASVSHVFNAAGTFNVVVTASDGKGGSATASGSVSARSLAGIWSSQARAWNFEIQHVGGQITGKLLGFKNVTYASQPPLAGTVKSPRAVAFDVPGGLSFVGTANAAGTQLTGTLSEGSRDYGDVLERQ